MDLSLLYGATVTRKLLPEEDVSVLTSRSAPDTEYTPITSLAGRGILYREP
jgi:hypothetical protein